MLFLRLMRFNTVQVARGRWAQVRLNQSIDVPEEIDFLRSGPYRLVAALLHHGDSPHQGHYTCLCREGSGHQYRWYDDRVPSGLLTWQEARACSYGNTTLSVGCYVLVYVRSRFWSDEVGDGSERTPYLRDADTVDEARRFFRQRGV